MVGAESPLQWLWRTFSIKRMLAIMARAAVPRCARPGQLCLRGGSVTRKIPPSLCHRRVAEGFATRAGMQSRTALSPRHTRPARAPSTSATSAKRAGGGGSGGRTPAPRASHHPHGLPDQGLPKGVKPPRPPPAMVRPPTPPKDADTWSNMVLLMDKPKGWTSFDVVGEGHRSLHATATLLK